MGTFEFTSDKMVATGINPTEFSGMRLNLRTGGSTARVARSKAKAVDGGVEWPCDDLRLPVRHRYMSPVVIEFHTRAVRKAVAHSIIWLATLIDNETATFKLPIYKSDNINRLTQNYIENPENEPEVKVERVGTLEFTGRFKIGLDEDHAKFLSDNDQRETLESYEACVADGLRDGIVRRQVGPAVQKLAEDAYGETPDVDSDSDIENADRPMDYTDGVGDGIPGEEGTGNRKMSGKRLKKNADEQNDEWAKAFGEDPAALLRRRDGRKSGGNQARADTDDEDDSSDDEDEEQHQSLGEKISGYKKNEKDLHRKHRGVMQWKPVRTMKAMKDQMKVGVVKAKTRFSMTGREPDVEVYLLNNTTDVLDGGVEKQLFDLRDFGCIRWNIRWDISFTQRGNLW